MKMESYDVVVVGAGAAGMTTALFAADRGATVLMIDAASDVGGALHLSSASLSAAGVRRQKDKGIIDSGERHYVDSLRIAHGTGDLGKLRLWCDNAADTLEWLLDNQLEMGADQPTLHFAHEYYDVPRTFTPPRGGLSYIDVLKPLLQAAIDRGRIVLALKTRMTSLLVGQDGAVEGLLALDATGTPHSYFGRQTVLACGGYNANDSFWAELHGRPRRGYAYPHAMGDGLAAARAVGATIVHAENFLPTFGCSIDIDHPENYWINTRVGPALRAPWEISVNLDGKRFMAEDNPSPDARERALLVQPDMAFWSVYDSAIERAAPSLFLWPKDKVARAFRTHPDFRQAATLAELASLCGLPADAVTLTVARYNAGQAVGSDEFGRKHMPLPLAEPPFFAVKHYGGSVVSPAGLATDDAFRVLTSDSRVIPHLFAVGEVLGIGLFGYTFLGGAMVSSACTFGRLLGSRILDWSTA